MIFSDPLPRKVLLFLTLLIPPCISQAQISGLDFLNIGPNTTALALGETVTALPIGGSAIYTNPANLAFEPSSSLSAAYTLWIADIYNTHLAVNLKKKRRAFAFALLNSSSSDLEARQTPGPSDGTFSVNYLSLAAAYAQSIRNFSIGIAGQFLREEFYVNDASGYALSAGVSSHWLNERIRAGVSVLNVGDMNELVDQSTDLPINLRAGISAELFEFSPSQNRDFPILVAVTSDFIKPFEEGLSTDQSNYPYSTDGSFIFGIAFDMAETISLRGGYKTGDTERPLSFGMGISLEALNFNYAMVPFTTGFGTAHSVGLQYYF